MRLPVPHILGNIGPIGIRKEKMETATMGNRDN